MVSPSPTAIQLEKLFSVPKVRSEGRNDSFPGLITPLNQAVKPEGQQDSPLGQQPQDLSGRSRSFQTKALAGFRNTIHSEDSDHVCKMFMTPNHDPIGNRSTGSGNDLPRPRPPTVQPSGRGGQWGRPCR